MTRFKKTFDWPQEVNSWCRFSISNFSNFYYAFQEKNLYFSWKDATKPVLTVSSNTASDALNSFCKKRLNYPKNVIIGHLNINSV